MLFVLMLILCVLTIGLSIIFSDRDYEGLSLLCIILGTISVFITLVMIIILVGNAVNLPATEAQWQEEYHSLNYQVENNLYYMYDREELFERVIDWNKKLVKHQLNQNSIWIGIFYPESTVGVHKIDVEKIH